MKHIHINKYNILYYKARHCPHTTLHNMGGSSGILKIRKESQINYINGSQIKEEFQREKY